MSDELRSAMSAVIGDTPSTSPFANEPDEVEEKDEAELNDDSEDDTEETDDESNEEVDDSSDDESDEESDEDESDDEADEEDESTKTVPLAALHAERGKRKELSQQLSAIQSALAESQNKQKEYAEAFDNLVNQIEEQGLGDELKIKRPTEESDEVKRLRAAEQQRASQEQLTAIYRDIHEQVMDALPEFSAIDSGNDVQGETLMRMILADLAVGGKDVETAVHDNMQTLNSLVAATKKTASRQAVRPGKKPAKGSGARRSKPAAKRGSTDFFRDLAGGMLGEN